MNIPNPSLAQTAKTDSTLMHLPPGKLFEDGRLAMDMMAYAYPNMPESERRTWALKIQQQIRIDISTEMTLRAKEIDREPDFLTRVRAYQEIIDQAKAQNLAILNPETLPDEDPLLLTDVLSGDPRKKR